MRWIAVFVLLAACATEPRPDPIALGLMANVKHWQDLALAAKSDGEREVALTQLQSANEDLRQYRHDWAMTQVAGTPKTVVTLPIGQHGCNCPVCPR